MLSRLSRRVYSNLNRHQLLTRGFHKSAINYKIDIAAELKCRSLLDSLPSDFEYIFQNEDGTKRTPPDSELKKIAYLNKYANERTLSLYEIFFSYPKEHEDLYLTNDRDLIKLKASSGLIIDKVPYEDTATGEIKWQTIREGDEKEGWENIAYYTFVPGCVLLFIVLVWREDMDVTEWAKRELLYRVKAKAVEDNDQEVLDTFNKFGGKPESYEFDLVGFAKNDDVIVERILSGEYDRMATLKVNQQQLKKVVKAET